VVPNITTCFWKPYSNLFSSLFRLPPELVTSFLFSLWLNVLLSSLLALSRGRSAQVKELLGDKLRAISPYAYLVLLLTTAVSLCLLKITLTYAEPSGPSLAVAYSAGYFFSLLILSLLLYSQVLAPIFYFYSSHPLTRSALFTLINFRSSINSDPAKRSLIPYCCRFILYVHLKLALALLLVLLTPLSLSSPFIYFILCSRALNFCLISVMLPLSALVYPRVAS
jgi:hypothetical protein